MITDEEKDVALQFVLGLCGEDERESFLAALKESAELRELVSEYRDVFATLSVENEGVIPPADLRETILARASGEGDVIRGSFAPPARISRAAVVGWIVAACFAVAALLLFQETERLEKERDSLAAFADFRELEITDLAAQTEEMPDVSARVAWSGVGGLGMIELLSLPPAPAEKSYQLWIFEEGTEAPVSAGVFDPGSGDKIVFRPEREISKAVAFAVSVEVEGGRPQPEGPVILVGTTAG